MEEIYNIVPRDKRETRFFLCKNEITNIVAERIKILETDPRLTTLSELITTNPTILALEEIRQHVSPASILRIINEKIEGKKKIITCEEFKVSEMEFDENDIETQINQWKLQ